MVDVKAIKAEMVRNGYTTEKLAKELGITPRTLYSRFKNGEFGSREIEIMIDKLKLTDPVSIFFN